MDHLKLSKSALGIAFIAACIAILSLMSGPVTALAQSKSVPSTDSSLSLTSEKISTSVGAMLIEITTNSTDGGGRITFHTKHKLISGHGLWQAVGEKFDSYYDPKESGLTALGIMDTLSTVDGVTYVRIGELTGGDHYMVEIDVAPLFSLQDAKKQLALKLEGAIKNPPKELSPYWLGVHEKYLKDNNKSVESKHSLTQDNYAMPRGPYGTY